MSLNSSLDDKVNFDAHCSQETVAGCPVAMYLRDTKVRCKSLPPRHNSLHITNQSKYMNCNNRENKDRGGCQDGSCHTCYGGGSGNGGYIPSIHASGHGGLQFDTYTVNVECYNCRVQTPKFRIEKGVIIKDAICPNCGCFGTLNLQ